MSTFFTADTHFGHGNIIKYCDRPFDSVEEMDAKLIDNWNKVVTEDDHVFVLGDFVWPDRLSEIPANTLLQCVKKLKGEIYLIPGNHDTMPLTELGKYRYLEPRLHICSEVFDGAVGGQRFTMCHYPMLTWDESHTGAWQLYGHMHDVHLNATDRLLSMNVGVDVNNFTPVAYSDVVKYMEEKKQSIDDLNWTEHLSGVKKGLIR